MHAMVWRAAATELEKIAAKKGRSQSEKFCGLARLEISTAERRAFGARLRQAGLRSGSVSLSRTSKGFAAHTHRARSKWYSSPEQIPLAKLKWIESTG